MTLTPGLVECPICRFTYFPDIPDDRHAHRRRHAEEMKTRRAKPNRRFADGADVIVDEASPARLHKLVYQRARSLMRDEHFSSNPQWNPDCPPQAQGERLHAILLVEDSTPVGAVSFHYVTWTDEPAGWHLNFAWVAPPWRRKGVLTKRWPRWLATYGEFTLEQPFSAAMVNFLAKHGLAFDEDGLSEGTG